MIGAIAGDIIGSVYENFRTRRRTTKSLWKKAMEFSRRFGIKEIVERLDSLGDD